MGQSDSDEGSDYVVEEYIRPTKVAKKLKNDESEDLLGNFKDIPKDQNKEYGTFPKEVFDEDFDHDTKLDLLDAPAKKTKPKSEELKKKIRKKVMAKIGKAKKKKLLGTG